MAGRSREAPPAQVRVQALSKQRERGRKGFSCEVERLKIHTRQEDKEKKETEVCSTARVPALSGRLVADIH